VAVSVCGGAVVEVVVVGGCVVVVVLEVVVLVGGRVVVVCVVGGGGAVVDVLEVGPLVEFPLPSTTVVVVASGEPAAADAMASTAVVGISIVGWMTRLRTWETAPHENAIATSAANAQPAASLVQFGML